MILVKYKSGDTKKINYIINKRMDLSKFTNKNKGATGSSKSDNAISRSFNKVKYWLLPPTSDKRK